MKIDSTFRIPRSFNSIGIIDGQHRLYSYHEGNDRFDRQIAALRQKQHLLVTGIVYPPQMQAVRKERFEAQMFLEINDKQKRVKGDLKQAIERIITPYSPIAIAKAVVTGLATSGPLVGKLEVRFYETGRIKTTSIVSYGMKHIVALDSEHSFYRRWRDPQKGKIRTSKEVLDRYVSYCVSQINIFLAAFKSVVPEDMWTTDRKTSRVLTTTTINGLVFCLRKLIEENNLSDFEGYKDAFKHLKVSFAPEEFAYKSSHWKSLGDKILAQCFK